MPRNFQVFVNRCVLLFKVGFSRIPFLVEKIIEPVCSASLLFTLIMNLKEGEMDGFFFFPEHKDKSKRPTMTGQVEEFTLLNEQEHSALQNESIR